MNKKTMEALDWLMSTFPNHDDLIRAYPMNMVIFIAQCMAKYHDEMKSESENDAK